MTDINEKSKKNAFRTRIQLYINGFYFFHHLRGRKEITPTRK